MKALRSVEMSGTDSPEKWGNIPEQKSNEIRSYENLNVRRVINFDLNYRRNFFIR
jgi:hypothetical protein